MMFKWSVIGLALLTGCSTSATITPRYGNAFDAEIIKSDGTTVHVKGPDGSRALKRAEIADIDHPGNVAAVIGGVVAAYGVANIAVGAPQCAKEDPSFCVGVFTPAIVGASIMTWGISTYIASVVAFGDTPRKPQVGHVFVLPTHEFAGQPKTPGLSVGSTF